MKISQMLKREDFYTINEKTLNSYFKGTGQKVKLFVYPELNAIITSSPSKLVKKYLYNEYSVKGNILKALVVKGYVFACLISKGLMAAKKLEITGNMTNDMLIYPCNKKYRIFDFATNSVDVIAKNGFPTNDLEREMAFRTQNKEQFIPGLIKAGCDGYSESIIDGIPLARLNDGFEGYQNLAIETLEKYSEKQGKVRVVPAKEYADNLFCKIKEVSQVKNKKIDKELLIEIAQYFVDKITDDMTVKLTLSHGDLQPGNIWIEKTGKMYIIDWESWNERSLWYDRAVLFKNIRNGGLQEYIKNTKDVLETTIVCLEDIIFRLNELCNLPFNYGEEEFANYLKIISYQKKG